jgi:transposase
MSLSETERITILMMRGYGDRTRTYDEVTHLFNDTYPNRPPIQKSTVLRTVQRFTESGSVKDRPRPGRPKSATNEEMALETLQCFVENPHTSIRKSAQYVGVSIGSIHKILKDNKFHPFKIQLHQELNEDDPDRRLQYCEIVMNKCIHNEDFPKLVLFSDEASFCLNGSVNRHNSRYWSQDNPRWMTEAHTQHPQKVNVWAGLLGTRVVGPYFIEGNLNAISYHELLDTRVIPDLRELLGPEFEDIWFQHDGAPPHFGLQVRELLDETFEDKWIGRRGTIEWPPRSPDLSPLDYFFWGVLKGKVYETKPANIEALKERILEEARNITEEIINNVMIGYYQRMAHCQAAQGHHFEHLL